MKQQPTNETGANSPIPNCTLLRGLDKHGNGIQVLAPFGADSAETFKATYGHDWDQFEPIERVATVYASDIRAVVPSHAALIEALQALLNVSTPEVFLREDEARLGAKPINDGLVKAYHAARAALALAKGGQAI